MPDFCSGYYENESPEILIQGIPEGTATLAIIMDDMDHPIFPGFNHWIAWNIPPVDRIPRALAHGAVVEEPFHIEQGVAYGKHCYRGPKPPFNWNHRYRIVVYALKTRLDISTDSKKNNLVTAMEGSILAQGELIGKYQRKHK